MEVQSLILFVYLLLNTLLEGHGKPFSMLQADEKKSKCSLGWVSLQSEGFVSELCPANALLLGAQHLSHPAGLC